MQSDTIEDLLDNKSASHLRYELEIPKIKKTLFKELICEDLVERHAILDVMYYGDIEEEIDPDQQDYYFPETMNVIDKYADPQFIDKTRPKCSKNIQYSNKNIKKLENLKKNRRIY